VFETAEERLPRQAADNGHLWRFKERVTTGLLEPALRAAFNRGHAGVLWCLLNQGADLHHHGEVSLRWAARCNRVEAVDLLLERGAGAHANKECALAVL